MTIEKSSEAIDVGHAMAKLLLEWRPNFSRDDVNRAIMHALERYSITIEGSNEAELAACLHDLKEKIDRRVMSI